MMELSSAPAFLLVIKDDQPVAPGNFEEPREDSLTRIPSPAPQPDEDAAWHALLAHLWAEIEELPPLQRLAYLLNFTDGQIEWFWFYGIVSLRRLGQTLALTNEQFQRLWVLLDWRAEQRQTARLLTTYDEQFALLWHQLPLPDLTIAALLETTRQNVINLRQAARQQLWRKLRARLAILPADSHL